MIFIVYSEEYDAYKFMLNVNGTLSTIVKYKLISVINGGKEDLKTIKKLFNAPAGWVPVNDNVEKFIFNRQINITVSIAIYKDRMFISLTDIAKLKRYLHRELYYDIDTIFIEYKIPATKLAETVNNLQKFHIKHSVYQLNEESRQILAGLEQFKTCRAPYGRVN